MDYGTFHLKYVQTQTNDIELGQKLSLIHIFKAASVEEIKFDGKGLAAAMKQYRVILQNWRDKQRLRRIVNCPLGKKNRF